MIIRLRLRSRWLPGRSGWLVRKGRVAVLLLVGDDWAEDHHDVEVQDETGRRLAKARLPEGVEGIARLHAMLAGLVGEDSVEPVEVVVGIETERGPWVRALLASGYRVYAINPLQVARYRERLGVSGAKSDPGDGHVLANMLRTDRHQLRPVAGDSDLAEALKVVARAHKTLIWERTRHMTRLRRALLDFFPAAVAAFEDLCGADTLELLGVAPDPAAAAGLDLDRIAAALRRAHRHHVPAKAAAIQAALQTPQLTQPAAVVEAYAAIVQAQAAILTTLNTQIKTMHKQVKAHFGRHPDAEIYLSQPGLGIVLGARELGEFGDDKTRYTDGKARKNYAATSPVTRQSGKKKTVHARHVHNDWLLDAVSLQAFAALNTSPGARAYYDRQRARGLGHRAALRQLANRLVGILHGCLKTRTPYNETTAWAHHQQDQPTAA